MSDHDGQSELREQRDRANRANQVLSRALTEAKRERDEARQWARHGYEIGQRSNLWSDYGVAPTWLIEGWPAHFDDVSTLNRPPTR